MDNGTRLIEWAILIATILGFIIQPVLTYFLEKRRDKRIRKLENDNSNNHKNYQNLKLENRILKERIQGIIKALDKINKDNPEINDSINKKENLSKLSVIRDEIAAEFKKSYCFAFSQFVKENFIILISSPSNSKELNEKGWDIRLDKEVLKKMIWELKTFRIFKQ